MCSAADLLTFVCAALQTFRPSCVPHSSAGPFDLVVCSPAGRDGVCHGGTCDGPPFQPLQNRPAIPPIPGLELISHNVLVKVNNEMTILWGGRLSKPI